MTTIAHISDLHFGRLNQAAADGLVHELFQLRPDLVVISGDLTQRARPGQYEAARAFIGRLPIPQIIVPGNHDVPLYDFMRRLRDPLGRFRYFITTDEFPEFENDDVHVVGINTACRLAPRISGFWKDGKIRPRHLQKLAQLFGTGPNRAAGSRQVKVVVAHHPFIEPPGGHRHGTIHGARAALPTFEQLSVDLILGGHLHLSFHGDVRGQHPQVRRPIVNILAGSATSTRGREAHNAYYLLHVSRESGVTLRRRAFVDRQWRDGGEPVSVALQQQNERGGHR